MIKKVVEIDVKLKGNENAEDRLQRITDIINEQKQITIEFEQELEDVRRLLRDTPKTALPAQKKLKERQEQLRDAIRDQKLALKSLNVERSKIKGITSQTKGQAKLTKSYFETNEAMHDINRLTREYALKLKGLKNLILGSTKAVISFVRGLSLVKKALIATGIGALVVGLGLVIEYWDEITDAIKGTNKELEKQIKLNEENTESLDNSLSLLEAQEKLLKSQGKSTKAIKKAKEDILELQIRETESLIKNLELRLKEKQLDAVKLTFLQKAANLAKAAFGQTPDLVPEITQEEKDTLAEIEKSISDAKIKATELRAKIIELNKPAIDDSTGEEVTPLQATIIGLDRELELIDVSNAIKAAKERSAGFVLNQIKEDIRQEDLENEQAYIDARIAMQLTLAKSIGMSLGHISSLFDESTAASKAAALSEIVIGTGIGFIQGLDIAQKSAKGTGTAAAFAFPIFYAQQIAAVLGAASQAKNILSTVKGGGNGGGLPAVSSTVDTPQAVSPDFNIAGSSGINQIADIVGEQVNKPVKAFVVSNEVTTGQALDRSIVGTAGIG